MSNTKPLSSSITIAHQFQKSANVSADFGTSEAIKGFVLNSSGLTCLETMSRFLSSRFAALSAYTPGEQPQDKQYVKLNTNESPYPPCEATIAAVHAAAQGLNLYPDPTARVLREKLAARYGVPVVGHIPMDYHAAYESDEALIQRGLIKPYQVLVKKRKK